jgi:hypothetical protein
MHSFTAATLVAFAGAAAAYHAPTGAYPSGNPFSYPSASCIVPACKPYKITWDPTTEGSVTLVLVRGPPENVKPVYTIADNIPNSGSYEWTPSSDTEADTTHYGIQLICDTTGAYQYTPQFGVSTDDCPVETYPVSTPCTTASAEYTTPCTTAIPEYTTPCTTASPVYTTPCTTATPEYTTPCTTEIPEHTTPCTTEVYSTPCTTEIAVETPCTTEVVVSTPCPTTYPTYAPPVTVSTSCTTPAPVVPTYVPVPPPAVNTTTYAPPAPIATGAANGLKAGLSMIVAVAAVVVAAL